MKIKKTTLYLAGIIILVIWGGFFFLNDEGSATENIVSAGGRALQGEIQRVVLSQDGYNYKDAVVDVGKPIEIRADSSVRGCLRAVVFSIDGNKYSKYLKTPEDTLVLPALKKGVYAFSCSMGMGYGKLIAK